MKAIFANSLDVMLDAAEWKESAHKRKGKGKGGGQFTKGSGGGGGAEAGKKAEKEKPSAKEQPGHYENVKGTLSFDEIKNVSEEECKKQGFPVEKLKIIPKGTAHDFTLNGKQMTAGGTFHPNTGEIKMYEGSTSWGKVALVGVLSHEIQHARYDSVRTACFYSSSADYETRKEANRITQSIYQPELRAKLEKSDGVTDYSREYWTQYRNSQKEWDLDSAVNETLAEIARLDRWETLGYSNEGDKPAPEWRSLYNAVNKVAKKVSTLKEPVKAKNKIQEAAAHKAWQTRQNATKMKERGAENVTIGKWNNVILDPRMYGTEVNNYDYPGRLSVGPEFMELNSYKREKEIGKAMGRQLTYSLNNKDYSEMFITHRPGGVFGPEDATGDIIGPFGTKDMKDAIAQSYTALIEGDYDALMVEKHHPKLAKYVRELAKSKGMQVPGKVAPSWLEKKPTKAKKPAA